MSTLEHLCVLLCIAFATVQGFVQGIDRSGSNIFKNIRISETPVLDDHAVTKLYVGKWSIIIRDLLIFPMLLFVSLHIVAHFKIRRFQGV